MIRLISSPELADCHVKAVMNRVRKSFDEVSILTKIQKLGCRSIENFLLADVDTLRHWINNSSELLQFNDFKDMYSRFFSNGADKYVDGKYNAYSFIEELEVTVCPYCDDEYIDIVKVEGRQKRTSEVDHFFPKSEYPALAMCFYNLVPCGQVCNGLKTDDELGSNPHEANIESLTHIYPDLEIGILLDQVDPLQCAPKFHPKRGMVRNVDILTLEQRYSRHAEEVHRLLLNLQRYNVEKLNELERMGFGDKEQLISTIFAPQNPNEKRKALRQKMIRDLTGY